MSFLKNLLSKLGSLLGAFFSGFMVGKLREKNKNLKDQIGANEQKNKTHNRVVIDADYRERIRRMFDGQ